MTEKLPKVTDFLREIGKNLAKMATFSVKIVSIVSIKSRKEGVDYVESKIDS